MAMLGAGEMMQLWDLGPGLFLNKACIVCVCVKNKTRSELAMMDVKGGLSHFWM